MLLTIDALDPFRGDFNGYGQFAFNEMQYNARYLFEQFQLPMTVYEHEDVFEATLNQGLLIELDALLAVIWSNAAAAALLETMVDLLELSFLEAMLLAELLLHDLDFRLERLEESGLSYTKHIEAIDIIKLDDGDINIALLQMRQTGWALLSSYVAIADIPGSGLTVFTLERSFGHFLQEYSEPIYFFCVVFADGSRQNLGAFPNDPVEFVLEIASIIDYFR